MEFETPNVKFSDGLVYRKFTKEWNENTLINKNKIPSLVKVIVDQNAAMVEYIEKLHDTIDFMIRKNNICDMPGCLTANCGSDHK